MPLTYQNARRQAEQTIGLEAMRLVFFCGAFNPTADDAARIKVLLDEAVDETPLTGTEKDRLRQRRRVVTLLQDVMVKPFVARGDPASKFGLSVYYLLRNLIETGVMTLDEGSKADMALEASLDVLSSYTTAQFATMDRAAFSAAQDMLERLKSAGYFHRAHWVIEFEPTQEFNADAGSDHQPG